MLVIRKVIIHLLLEDSHFLLGFKCDGNNVKRGPWDGDLLLIFGLVYHVIPIFLSIHTSSSTYLWKLSTPFCIICATESAEILPISIFLSLQKL